ncbi:MAG: HAMP domain-containing histidine kinase [Neisseriaceae bacterium]|nr:HAMP domain-containing histidine kinase [Neisseriaceae bacterium]
MKLFQRIFLIFCLVILCTMMVASFVFAMVRDNFNRKYSEQQRAIETSLLTNAQIVFQTQGEEATEAYFKRLRSNPIANNIVLIEIEEDGEYEDILDRNVSEAEIRYAYNYALTHNDSSRTLLYTDPFKKEYLFFVRHFDQERALTFQTGLIIPGLPIAPVWHEFIVLGTVLIVGLLLAYLIAANIAHPIKILENGMNRLAKGDLDARVSQQLSERKDELAVLGGQFDKMAAQLQKLMARERHLLHHVSHEMRSPLARIQAILGLLQARPDKQAEYLSRLESEVNRMDNLVGELLTLSRLETSNAPLNKEPLTIVSLLAQLVDECQEIAQQNQQTLNLTIQGMNDNNRFDGNESYLYRAFDNVIRNAMKYSPSGSTIDVKMYEDRKNLRIDVTDNGPGIKEEQLAHIFTAFYRADSSGNSSGTGLGLAITKYIIEQHQGKIIAENVQPNGLKMSFVLPKTYIKKSA